MYLAVKLNGLGDSLKSSLELIGDEHDLQKSPHILHRFLIDPNSFELKTPITRPVIVGQAEHRFGAIDLCSPVPVLANLG